MKTQPFEKHVWAEIDLDEMCIRDSLKGMSFKGMQVRKRHLRPLLLSRSVGS